MPSALSKDKILVELYKGTEEQILNNLHDGEMGVVTGSNKLMFRDGDNFVTYDFDSTEGTYKSNSNGYVNGVNANTKYTIDLNGYDGFNPTSKDRDYAFLAPASGRLLSINALTSQSSAINATFFMENDTGSFCSVLETITSSAPVNFDFKNPDTGSSTFSAGQMIYITMSASPAPNKINVNLTWEFDLPNYVASSTTSGAYRSNDSFTYYEETNTLGYLSFMGSVNSLYSNKESGSRYVTTDAGKLLKLSITGYDLSGTSVELSSTTIALHNNTQELCSMTQDVPAGVVTNFDFVIPDTGSNEFSAGESLYISINPSKPHNVVHVNTVWEYNTTKYVTALGQTILSGDNEIISSIDSMTFNIDSDNNASGQKFVWQHNKSSGLEGIQRKIKVDIYQPMVSGTDNQLLTSALMNAGDHHNSDLYLYWNITSAGGVSASSDLTSGFPGTVEVSGVEYNEPNFYSWKFQNRYQNKLITLGIEDEFESGLLYDQMTLGCFFQAGHNQDFWTFHDNIIINGSDGTEWAALQTYGSSGLTINGHSSGPDTSFISITPDKKYWINLLFDGINGKCKVAVIDPDTWNHIPGSPQETTLTVGKKTKTISFGRTDGHGDTTELDDTNLSYFGHIMFDLSGTFPLLPDAISDGKYLATLDDSSDFKLYDTSLVPKVKLSSTGTSYLSGGPLVIGTTTTEDDFEVHATTSADVSVSIYQDGVAVNTYDCYLKFMQSAGWELIAKHIQNNEYDIGFNYNNALYTGKWYIGHNGVKRFIIDKNGDVITNGFNLYVPNGFTLQHISSAANTSEMFLKSKANMEFTIDSDNSSSDRKYRWFAGSVELMSLSENSALNLCKTSADPTLEIERTGTNPGKLSINQNSIGTSTDSDLSITRNSVEKIKITSASVQIPTLSAGTYRSLLNYHYFNNTNDLVFLPLIGNSTEFITKENSGKFIPPNSGRIKKVVLAPSGTSTPLSGTVVAIHNASSELGSVSANVSNANTNYTFDFVNNLTSGTAEFNSSDIIFVSVDPTNNHQYVSFSIEWEIDVS